MCKIAQLITDELEADAKRGTNGKLWQSDLEKLRRALTRHTNCNCKGRYGKGN